ncbi:hypothetical protein PUNSTDRAFT_134666 [Punctularia strigosozonata HHB-11173 SS5]|uniref:uncharacterized protein n=1 Tax=Punctularia strigosozonata (strain HHB-11173) TaxID=741275 RepID=UPI0004417B5C|nr:uncharacterized protein PUNSTDRAFT_134666 [Punctularia strigosozonata HHB-11173 SS5]EIN08274.1 hypothetical protein PUNSTDRAFT_134666 [Punctularia strigosozonata HHB-11173 SS5]
MAIKAADIAFAEGYDEVQSIIQGLSDQSLFRKILEDELSRLTSLHDNLSRVPRRRIPVFEQDVKRVVFMSKVLGGFLTDERAQVPAVSSLMRVTVVGQEQDGTPARTDDIADIHVQRDETPTTPVEPTPACPIVLEIPQPRASLPNAESAPSSRRAAAPRSEEPSRELMSDAQVDQTPEQSSAPAHNATESTLQPGHGLLLGSTNIGMWIFNTSQEARPVRSFRDEHGQVIMVIVTPEDSPVTIETSIPPRPRERSRELDEARSTPSRSEVLDKMFDPQTSGSHTEHPPVIDVRAPSPPPTRRSRSPRAPLRRYESSCVSRSSFHESDYGRTMNTAHIAGNESVISHSYVPAPIHVEDPTGVAYSRRDDARAIHAQNGDVRETYGYRDQSRSAEGGSRYAISETWRFPAREQERAPVGRSSTSSSFSLEYASPDQPVIPPVSTLASSRPSRLSLAAPASTHEDRHQYARGASRMHRAFSSTDAGRTPLLLNEAQYPYGGHVPSVHATDASPRPHYGQHVRHVSDTYVSGSTSGPYALNSNSLPGHYTTPMTACNVWVGDELQPAPEAAMADYPHLPTPVQPHFQQSAAASAQAVPAHLQDILAPSPTIYARPPAIAGHVSPEMTAADYRAPRPQTDLRDYGHGREVPIRTELSPLQGYNLPRQRLGASGAGYGIRPTDVYDTPSSALNEQLPAWSPSTASEVLSDTPRNTLFPSPPNTATLIRAPRLAQIPLPMSPGIAGSWAMQSTPSSHPSEVANAGYGQHSGGGQHVFPEQLDHALLNPDQDYMFTLD